MHGSAESLWYPVFIAFEAHAEVGWLDYMIVQFLIS